MSVSRMKIVGVGLSFPIGLLRPADTRPDLDNPQNNDPHKPRPRSKGEKARNRKCRAR